MPTAVITVDAELAVRNFLAGRGEIVATVGRDARDEPLIYTIVPNPAPAGPFIRLYRVGGTPDARRNIDRPLIQIESYGGTKAQARNLIALVLEQLEALDGADAPGVQGHVQGLTAGTLRYLPDVDLQTERGRARERYIVDVAFLFRADISTGDAELDAGFSSGFSDGYGAT